MVKKNLIIMVMFLFPIICFSSENLDIKKSDRVTNKFSIGINYSPLVIDIYQASGSGFSVTCITDAEASIQSLIQYNVFEKLSIFFSFSYRDSDTKMYYKRTKYNETQNQGQETIDGYEIKSVTSSILPLIGFKYYLKYPEIKKVSPYLNFGVGKQFFLIDYTRKDFEEEETNYIIIKDTGDEFDEGINSPFILQFGFGSEYYLNQAISFTLNTSYEYLKIKSSYKYYKEGTSEYEWYDKIDQNITDKKINTLYSFGIYFHF